MSVRPPSQYRTEDKDPLAAALAQEVMAEKVGTLARLTRKLDEALARLEGAARRLAEAPEDERLRSRHQDRLEEAAEALWHVVIQRELCGLRQHREFLDLMQVPAPVRLRMGPRPARR
ncbi:MULTISPECIES: DUF6665 family protein [unclassified Pannonibacter]|uniref:DUF6665 family protein n=1 Tax=unclassified Pannonibacter TaxID=2627228 RepID=UPI001647FFC0|nr:MULTISPECIES: DUF6665 family protein [unclassified Pannonibacter]